MISTQSLAEIVQKLVGGYPGQDLQESQREFTRVLEIVLPALRKRVVNARQQGNDSAEDIWKTIRGGAEGEFEKALQQIDRLKVLYVTSKFMNNKSVGTAITEIVLSSIEAKEDQNAE